MYKNIFTLLFIVGGIVSCNKEAEIPAYIYIEDIKLETTGEQGSDRDNMVDIYLSANDQIIGGFEFPCTIPVHHFGDEVELSARGGIKLNGQAGTRAPYDCFDIAELYNSKGEKTNKFSLKPGEVTTVKVTQKYKENLDFIELEDFEGPGISLESIELKDTTKTPAIYNAEIKKTENNVFEGDFSGTVTLTNEKSGIFLATSKEFEIPELNSRNYLELDYKSDVEMAFGIWYNTGSGSQTFIMGGVNPKADWNKIIFRITPEKQKDPNAGLPAADKYKFFISASLPDGKDQASFSIDNLKLIHSK